jgi:hypothetical protein
MPWFWKNKKTPTQPKTKKLSFSQIEKLNKIGDDLTNFLAKGQRKAGAIPSKLVEESTRGELRAALIENLMVLLQKGLPFTMQIQCMEGTASLFVLFKSFDTPRAGGRREIEADEPYNKSLELWDEFQKLVVRDGGRRFEVNEDEIREKIVIKLIEPTNNP